jgi:hypothetical protein
MNGSDAAVPVTGSTALVDEKTWTVQAGSLNSLKVTVPVGRKPKEMPAVSRSAAPTVAVPGVALVPMTGLDLATVICSRGSRQSVGPAGLLLASPLYMATQW